jgi:hypothetical protein
VFDGIEHDTNPKSKLRRPRQGFRLQVLLEASRLLTCLVPNGKLTSGARGWVMIPRDTGAIDCPPSLLHIGVHRKREPMGIFNLFRSKKPKAPPTPFETLAAFSKFQNVPECNPEFYARHQNAINMTKGFLGFLGSQHEHFARVFTHSSAPLPAIAKAVESAMSAASLEQRTLDFIDSTMTTVMETLLPVVKDSELPAYLQECVWPIEGAFEPDPSPGANR